MSQRMPNERIWELLVDIHCQQIISIGWSILCIDTDVLFLVQLIKIDGVWAAIPYDRVLVLTFLHHIFIINQLDIATVLGRNSSQCSCGSGKRRQRILIVYLAISLIYRKRIVGASNSGSHERVHLARSIALDILSQVAQRKCRNGCIMGIFYICIVIRTEAWWQWQACRNEQDES